MNKHNLTSGLLFAASTAFAVAFIVIFLGGFFVTTVNAETTATSTPPSELPPPPSSGGGGSGSGGSGGGGGGSLNHLPTLSTPLQWDGSTSIDEGWIMRPPRAISFSANISDPDGDQVKLEVELRRFEELFTGIDDGGILTSNLMPSGSENVRMTRFGLTDGKYHWRARAVDSHDNKSAWQEFRIAGNVDFEILTCQTSPSGLNTCDLHKGDILLLHSNNILFFVEATLFSGYWTHAGIYNGDGTVTESYPSSLFNGFSLNDLPGVVSTSTAQSLFWRDDVTDWAVLRVGSDTTKQGNAVNYAENQDGKHYNYDFPDKETELKFYCSQLVWRAYQTQGVDLDSNLSFFGAATKWLTPTGLLTGITLVNAVPPDDIYFSPNASIIQQRPGTLTGVGRWVLRLLSPGTLLVTDPQGRRIGIDPVTNTNLQEIPNASYSGPNTEPQTIAIEQLDEGTWKIQVVGTGNGTYTLQAESINRDSHTVITDPGTISTEAIATYQLLNPGDGSQPTLTQIVNIDIKLGADTAPINLNSKGVIPVAILTTDSFDATIVDPLSVKFGSSGATSTQNSFGDINGDGKLDLVLHFPTQQTGIKNSDTQACLTG